MTGRQGTFDRQSAYARLYEVMKTDRPLEDRLRDALDVGVEQFGVDLGYIAETDAETDDFEVVVSTNPPDRPDPTGLQEELTNTYCKRTIEQEGLVSFADAADEGLEDHPAALKHGIHCYHGAPILTDGEPYGTVCFTSQDPRAEPFSEAEKSFSHLVAQMAGYEIEQREYERELAEREGRLNERREIYRAVIDANFDMVFRLDCQGRFTFNSDSSTDFLGYEPEELDGEPMTMVHPDEEATGRAWELFDQVMTGETIEEHYFPLETKTGEIVYADIRGTPIYDCEVAPDERTPEDIVGAQGMSRDATDRKRRDGLISVINRVLRHNLRNDVGVIGGYAEMLEADLDGQQERLARRVRTTADRLVDLSETAQKLEQNLDTPTERERLDLRSIADRVAEELAAEYPAASITVTAPESVVIESAPRLETAVWELVDNAANHAGEAPTVEISIEETPTHAEVYVRDEGPGLPGLEQSVLQSGEETPLVHGQGLGLWLVYWIVTGVGGSVDVIEPQRIGTTIRLRVPNAD